MEWVASTPQTTPEHGVSSITTADAHTSAANSRLNLTSPADLNGLVRFAKRRKSGFCACPSTFQLASNIWREGVSSSLTSSTSWTPYSWAQSSPFPQTQITPSNVAFCCHFHALLELERGPGSSVVVTTTGLTVRDRIPVGTRFSARPPSLL